MSHKCSRCKVEKPRAAFTTNKRYRSGLSSYCKICFAAYSRERRYGVTPAIMAAMLEAQEHQCASCGDVFPDNKSTHVDHDHETDEVRALLCRDCNVALGLLRDDPLRITALLTYLESHMAVPA